MGTRFMVTRESVSHKNVKEAIVKGEDACTVSVPKDFMMARDLANKFTKKYLEMRNAGAGPEELNNYLNENGQYQSQCQGKADDAEICCGQVAGLISEVQSAGGVMRDVVGTISSRFEELKRKVNDFF
jgi:enoyl-[acyl-carrier protein] reductase II